MRRFFFAIVASFVAAAASRAQSTGPDSSAKSVWKGVYTEEQATRGDTEHQNNCSSCHGTEKYAGDAFTKNWVGRTVFDLFDQIKTTMPDDNPGGLSVQQYKDIVAYILKTNGIPAGTDSLPGDPEAMRLLKIDAKPDKQTALRPMYHPHDGGLGGQERDLGGKPLLARRSPRTETHPGRVAGPQSLQTHTR